VEEKNFNGKWMASKAKATKFDDLHVDRIEQRHKNFSQASLLFIIIYLFYYNMKVYLNIFNFWTYFIYQL
jgi:hypothetical protein